MITCPYSTYFPGFFSQIKIMQILFTANKLYLKQKINRSVCHQKVDITPLPCVLSSQILDFSTQERQNQKYPPTDLCTNQRQFNRHYQRRTPATFYDRKTLIPMLCYKVCVHITGAYISRSRSMSTEGHTFICLNKVRSQAATFWDVNIKSFNG